MRITPPNERAFCRETFARVCGTVLAEIEGTKVDESRRVQSGEARLYTELVGAELGMALESE